jgi:LuxR family maltose regulon positive regulatory protein
MSIRAYTQLITTKIVVPPPRPHIVVRQRLLEMMDDAVSRPLTLISAPAGFGKTTLITSWLYETGNQSRTAWLSLDQDDSDPVHFAYYMIATLQAIEPRVGRALISLLGSLKMPGLEDLMSLLLNELAAAQDRILLVLNDYHSVRNPDVDSALAFLIERIPEQFRLIISTREEPRLPLARWRALERVVEIRLDDLRFSYEEALVFFKQTMGLNIDSRSARTLEDRTEGWIAGLQMAALSLRVRGRDETLIETAKAAATFSGRHRYLVEYLAAEVLMGQSDDTRAFLGSSPNRVGDFGSF